MLPARGFGLVLAVVALGGGFASFPIATGSAVAQATKSASKRISLADARKALSDGRVAVTAKNFDTGVRLLDVAINSKRLTRKELARALYYRGLGHRGRGQIASSVSDLTAALWMKNGLSKDERKAALAARASAYQTAGLSDQGQTNGDVGSGNAKPRTVARAAPRRTTTSGTSSSSSARANASWSTTTKDQPASSTSSSDPLAAAGNSVSNFFGSLFGSSGTASAANTPGPTGSLGPSKSATAVVSAWRSDARPAAAAAKPSTFSTSTARAAPKRGGNMQVRVAAMRGQGDAKALANRLNRKFGSALAGSTARVTGENVGNMGRFYVVQLGPFQSMSEVRPLCAQLKRDGLDCHVVTK
ncbi:MAG: SPOR domain-containing protein [Pseudomonadota bacterium]